MFGCCSRWVSCSYLGYCTHKSYEKERTYDGDTVVFNCSLGRNVFVYPQESFRESFYEDAKKHVEKGYQLDEYHRREYRYG